MKRHIRKTIQRCLAVCLALLVARCANAETDADCWNFDTAYVPASPIMRTETLSDSLDTFAFLVRTIVLPFEFRSIGPGFFLIYR